MNLERRLHNSNALRVGLPFFQPIDAEFEKHSIEVSVFYYVTHISSRPTHPSAHSTHRLFVNTNFIILYHAFFLLLPMNIDGNAEVNNNWMNKNWEMSRGAVRKMSKRREKVDGWQMPSLCAYQKQQKSETNVGENFQFYRFSESILKCLFPAFSFNWGHWHSVTLFVSLFCNWFKPDKHSQRRQSEAKTFRRFKIQDAKSIFLRMKGIPSLWLRW